jgi:hypothetical protein
MVGGSEDRTWRDFPRPRRRGDVKVRATWYGRSAKFDLLLSFLCLGLIWAGAWYAKHLLACVALFGGCPVAASPWPFEGVHAIFEGPPSLEADDGLCQALSSPWTLWTTRLAIAAYLAIIVLAFPLGRERIARLMCRYDVPPHQGWRALRRGLIIFAPFAAIFICVAAIAVSREGAVSFQFLSYVAISTAAVLATLGWLFSSFQNEKAVRKQHSLDVLMQMRHSAEYQAHSRLRRNQPKSWRGILDLKTAQEILDHHFEKPEGEASKSYYSTIVYFLNYFEYIAAGVRNGDLNERFVKRSLRSIIFDIYASYLAVICLDDNYEREFLKAEAQARARHRTLPKRVVSRTVYFDNLYWLLVRWKIHEAKSAQDIPIQIVPFKRNSLDAIWVFFVNSTRMLASRSSDKLANLRSWVAHKTG